MIPIFKSTFSIGKSILTLNDPSDQENDSSDSIFSIAIENNLKKIFLIEDSMVGFLEAFKKCSQHNIQLIFGYRFTCCNSFDNKDSCHKLIAIAKNDQGCRDLNKFYSAINTLFNGSIDTQNLQEYWTENMLLAVPFYDSFIYNNQLYLGNCIPDFGDIKPIFFIEKNNLPFDSIVEKSILNFTDNGKKYQNELVKSIYYKNRDDVEALQTYKILCNRSFGRQATLSSPNLNHFGSDEFCWESFKEYERKFTKI